MFVSAAASSGTSSPWPTFWSAVAALVALGALMRTLWFIPPRRLIFVKRKPQSLSEPRKGTDIPATIQLFLKIAAKLSDPKVIVITLAGSGRRDITRESFDQDKPIIVEASAPIVAVLHRSRPEWYRAPEVAVNGKVLEVGPDFIGSKQRLTYALLIDEERPSASLQSSLTDVVVTRRSRYTGRLRPTIKWFWYWLLVLACLTFIAWLIETYFWPQQALLYTYASSAYGFVFLIGLSTLSGIQSIHRDGAILDILIPVRADPVSEDKSGAAAQPKETP